MSDSQHSYLKLNQSGLNYYPVTHNHPPTLCPAPYTPAHTSDAHPPTCHTPIHPRHTHTCMLHTPSQPHATATHTHTHPPARPGRQMLLAWGGVWGMAPCGERARGTRPTQPPCAAFSRHCPHLPAHCTYSTLWPRAMPSAPHWLFVWHPATMCPGKHYPLRRVGKGAWPQGAAQEAGGGSVPYPVTTCCSRQTFPIPPAYSPHSILKPCTMLPRTMCTCQQQGEWGESFSSSRLRK